MYQKIKNKVRSVQTLSGRRQIAFRIIMGGTLVFLIWVAFWISYRITHVSSDAGFVKADMVELSPLVAGHVKEILVDEGRLVKAGDLLLTIDDRDYMQMLAKAEAAYSRSEANYNRQQKLHLSKVIPDARFEEVEASFKEAKASLEVARLNVEHTRIVAPFDGVIAKKYVEPGDFAAPGLPVLAIYDPNTMHVMVNLEESKVGSIAVGQKTDLYLEAVPGKLTGEVVRIGEATAAEFALIPRDVSAGEFTRVVQRIPVKISIKDVSKYEGLRPGFSVTVGIKRK